MQHGTANLLLLKTMLGKTLLQKRNALIDTDMEAKIACGDNSKDPAVRSQIRCGVCTEQVFRMGCAIAVSIPHASWFPKRIIQSKDRMYTVDSGAADS